MPESSTQRCRIRCAPSHPVRRDGSRCWPTTPRSAISTAIWRSRTDGSVAQRFDDGWWPVTDGTESTVRIGLVLPDVMGTYGDGGNALVLRQRLRMRGHDAEIVEITLSDPVTDALDIDTLGGAEDS